MRAFVLGTFLSFLMTSSWADHGVSAWGKLKYPETFTHFDYVNPDAPVGGEIVLGVLGSFSSFNMFIALGDPAAGLSLVHATLLEPAFDAVNEGYAYLAKDVHVSPDKKIVTFTLRDDATFSDGTQITSDDIAFSFDILIKKGLPVFRSYYREIERVQILSPHQIRFFLKTDKIRELPTILGQIPALSKAFYSKNDFAKPSLVVPPVSGAYTIDKVESGQSITYARRKQWWGSTLPCQKGRMNFERIRYVYYKDNNAMFEGFSSGRIHIRLESVAKLWATAYKFDAVKEGKIKLDSIKHSMSMGTYGLFFNTRREIFKSRNVRKALAQLYDFVWANKNLFYGQYTRNLTYFANADYASHGPVTEGEKEFLERAHIKLSKDTDNGFTLPEPKTDAEHRAVMDESLALLKQEGWALKGQKLLNNKGEQFSFTMFVYAPTFERIYAGYVNTLKSMGIDVRMRNIDHSSYQEKVDSLDFDVIMTVIPQGVSPGGEIIDYFGSQSVHQKGTRNFSGIQSKEIDALLHDIVESDTFERLKTGLKALDRALLEGYYMIPAWHSDTLPVAYWHQFARPEIAPKYNPIPLETWWFKGKEGSNPKKDSLTLEKSESVSQSSFLQRILAWFKGFFVKT